ncbi:MAG: peptide chain release factor 2 [Clostridia bacterium]|nr:peptide chain release factor 2 [Clostridia bacterium]
MIEFDEYRLKLTGMEKSIIELRDSLNIEKTQSEIDELEKETTSPDFYSDMEKAGKVLQKIKGLKNKIERFNKLVSERDDLLTLIELAVEENDESVLPEIKDGVKTFLSDFEEMKLETLFTGKYDKNNAILTLHSGAGGTEAQDWCEMLFRMYTMWAERRGFKTSTLDLLEGDEAGIKSVTFQIDGLNAYGYAKCEKGVHRLVRISPFDSSGRRHTSFASLDVMPEIDDDIEIDIRDEDLKVDTYRASGAGGQHVNKTESAIRITHIPTGVIVACQNERSQHKNRATAMKMLKSKLVEIAEREQKEKIEDLKGVQKEIGWGSQIRSYVFHPYSMVKDHRTNFETGNTASVMDGDLDGFINAYLTALSRGELNQNQ